MKPAARIQACIELLEKIAASRVPMDLTTADYMRGRRYIGAKDRAAIAERVYLIARARARLGWWLAKLDAADTPRTRVLAWLILGESRTASQAANLHDGDKYAPAPLDEAELALAAALPPGGLDNPEMPVEVRVECPPEHADTLHALFGADFESEMAAMMDGASLDLRLNAGKTPDRDGVRGSLASDGVLTDPTPYSPAGLRVRGKAFLSKTKAFAKGWIDIQDEGSQIVALLCAPKPGAQVLDFCAGGGGKTLALAAMMGGKGRIVATDNEAPRLEKARLRFRRAGISDIIEIRPLTDEKNRKWLRRQKQTFDVVLADVPCSGTGTWRRNPDTRWRNYGPPLAELLPVQADILDRAAKAVKPDGRFVYATCSLLPAENEEQVAAFLARNPEFEVMPLGEAWTADILVPGEGPYLRLTPKRHGTDGFFAAVLRRVPSLSPRGEGQGEGEE